MSKSFRTDLASEAFEQLGEEAHALRGAAVRRETLFGAPLLAVEISDEAAAAALGKPIGRYYTLELPARPRRASVGFEGLARAAAELIRRCGVPEDGQWFEIVEKYEKKHPEMTWEQIMNYVQTHDLPEEYSMENFLKEERKHGKI